MLDWVPDPVWNTTSGNSSSSLPSITSCDARTMRSTFVLGQLPEFEIRQRRAFLQKAESADHRPAPAVPLDADGEVLPRAFGLRAPQMLGRHPYVAERVFLDAEFLALCRNACHASLLRMQAMRRRAGESKRKPLEPLLPSRPRFSIRPALRAGSDTPGGRARTTKQGHHHGSDQATRGRDAQRDRQGGRPLRSSRRPRSRRHLWRRPETRADLGRLQGRQQAHLLRPLSDLDLRARGRWAQGARSAARLSARRRHRPAGPCRFSSARAGIAGADRRSGARRQSRGLAGIEEGRRGQSRAARGRGDGAGRRHSGIDHHRPHRPRFSRIRCMCPRSSCRRAAGRSAPRRTRRW